MVNCASLGWLLCAGKGDSVEQPPPKQGPAGWPHWLPAATRGPAAQGHPAEGPAGQDPDAGPVQTPQHQPGPQPPIPAGKDMSVHPLWSGHPCLNVSVSARTTSAPTPHPPSPTPPSPAICLWRGKKHDSLLPSLLAHSIFNVLVAVGPTAKFQAGIDHTSVCWHCHPNILASAIPSDCLFVPWGVWVPWVLSAWLCTHSKHLGVSQVFNHPSGQIIVLLDLFNNEMSLEIYWMRCVEGYYT